MITFLAILYCLASLVTATLALINLFDAKSYADSFDKASFAFAALGLGLVWPITIWVALIGWYSSGSTPAWVEALQKVRELFSKEKP